LYEHEPPATLAGSGLVLAGELEKHTSRSLCKRHRVSGIGPESAPLRKMSFLATHGCAWIPGSRYRWGGWCVFDLRRTASRI